MNKHVDTICSDDFSSRDFYVEVYMFICLY